MFACGGKATLPNNAKTIDRAARGAAHPAKPISAAIAARHLKLLTNSCRGAVSRPSRFGRTGDLQSFPLLR